MKFSSGVIAKITFKETLSNRGYEMFCSDSKDVYNCIIERFSHNIAADAESWTEMACIYDLYEEDGFEIEMMEE